MLLNTGILAISLSPITPGWSWMPFLGRLFQACGGIAFAMHFWPRVKPAGV